MMFSVSVCEFLIIKYYWAVYFDTCKCGVFFSSKGDKNGNFFLSYTNKMYRKRRKPKQKEWKGKRRGGK